MAINGQLSSDITSTIGTTTNGSSIVTIYEAPAFLADDGGQVITFDVIGMDFDNDEVASAKILVRLKNVGGTVTMIGTQIHLVPFAAGSSSGLINCSANVVISGTNIRVNVIGVTDRTIKWTCSRFPSLSVLDNWTAVPTPEDGYVNTWSDSNNRWEPESITNAVASATIVGDVSGTIGATTVDKIKGRAISATAPTDKYALIWDNGANNWKPVNIHLIAEGGDGYIRFSAATGPLDPQVSIGGTYVTIGAGSSSTVTINTSKLDINAPTEYFTSATAGSNGDVPSQVVGYLRIYLGDGSGSFAAYNIPYYNT